MSQEQTVVEAKPRDFNSQLSNVLVVADLLERGERSTKTIMARLSVSRPTAIKYRNDALALIQEESKPMNREALRHLEIGRLNYWIEHITQKLNDLAYDEIHESEKGAVMLVGHIKWNDYMRRLKDMAEQLHKITGMNTEVTIDIQEKRRIVFVRPLPAEPSPIIEG